MNFSHILMHELHDDGSFAYTGSHALHRAMAHISNHEYSWDVSF